MTDMFVIFERGMMQMKKWQFALGVFILMMGLFSLIQLVFNVDLWKFIFPLVLIGVGVFVILRPKIIEKNQTLMMRLFGDIRKVGEREITNEEYWLLAGDVNLDYASSIVPGGEFEIKIFLGFGEIRLTVPNGVGVKILCESMISEIRSEMGKEERIFQRNSFETPDYATMMQKISFKTLGIVNVVELDQLVKTKNDIIGL